MRNILITGGAKGIGAETARYFSAMGDNVTICYNTSRTEAEKLADQIGCRIIRADITKSDEVKQMISTVQRVDVLINNAGISGFFMLDTMTDSQWRNIIDTNLTGAFYCIREVLPQMISRKSGSIVNISSMWGEVGASCEVAYSASKAGLIGLTKALAKEVGPSGIRVNCIAPGLIDTDMNKALDQSTIAEICEETPLERVGTPLDIAKAIYFLADEKSFITGQVLGVNGGFVI